MRVALIHNLLTGGARRRVSEQLRAMSDDVTVDEFTLEGASPVTPDARVIPLSQVADQGSPFMRPISRYGDLRRLKQAWVKLGAIVEAGNYDAIWLNPCSILTVPPIQSDLLKRSVFYCDEPTRAYFDPSVKGSTRVLTRPLYAPLHAMKRKVELDAASEVAVVVTNSNYTSRLIERAYGRTSEVIPLGVNVQFVPPAAPPERSRALSVGTLISTKGHDLAICALAEAASVKSLMIIAPRQARGERERLQKLADASGIAVEFRFSVSDADLVTAYQSAAVTLYLARAEPFGLASLEAQACGSTVVVAHEGGLPETIHLGSLGKAVHREVQPVAAAIDALSGAVDERERVRAARVISSTWSWQASARRLEAQLRSVAKK